MKEFVITVNGKTYEVQVEEVGEMESGSPVPAAAARPAPKVVPLSSPAPAKAVGTAGKTTVKCPMPGSIVKINVSAGDAVKAGAVLCILEAMKMENEIKATEDGVIASVNVTKGANVNSGDVLFTIN